MSKLLVSILLSSLTLLIAACAPAAPAPLRLSPHHRHPPQRNAPAATQAPATTTAPATAGAAAAYPVEIKHKYGSTTLTKKPERIVLVGLTEQDALLALGEVPIATREWYGERPGAIFTWAQDKLGNAPVPAVLPSSELNFEQIAGLKPDLILGLYAGLTQEEYDTLAKIAPTIAQPEEYVDWGIPWQEATKTVGTIVGKRAEAEQLVAAVDAKFEQARKDHPEFQGATGVIASTYGFPENYWVYAPQDSRGRFMNALGFTIPQEVEEIAGAEYGATISRERMDIVDIDAVVWFADTAEQAESFRSEPVYQTLKLGKEGRDIFMTGADPVYDALNFSTVLSLPFAIDGLTPLLSAAVDGDPATTAASAAPAAGTTDSFPVTIEHKFGSTTIPAEPKRVVTVGFSEQDPVLALGVVPVAIREWFGAQPNAVWQWGQPKLGGAKPEVLDMPFGALNFESLIALKPDLIVATHSGITAEEYKTLSQIAPTLAQTSDYPDFGMPWQDQTRLIGKALSRSQQADTLVAEVQAEIAAAAAAHPEFADATIAWAIPSEGDKFWVVGPNTPPLRFLGGLGFDYPAETATVVGDLDSLEISSERLDLLDIDVLILKVASEEELAAVQANPLIQALQVAKDKRIIFFVGDTDPTYGALSFSTVLSLPFAVQELVPQLADALGSP